MGRLPDPTTPYDPAADFDHTGKTPMIASGGATASSVNGVGLELASLSQRHAQLPSAHVLVSASSHGFVQAAAAGTSQYYRDGIRRGAGDGVPEGPPRASMRGSGQSADPAASAYISAHYAASSGTATAGYVPPQTPPATSATRI